MSPTRPAPAGHFQQALRDSWANLGDAVRRLHASGGTVRAAGTFQVRHGSNFLARTLARLARLPAAGESVEVCLSVTPGEESELWDRRFAGRPVVTWMSCRADGMLLERVGLVEMRFRLEVVDAALHYRSVGAAVCLGRWRLPLPRWLRPSITAREMAIGAGEEIAISVDIHVPILGRMIAYEGRLTRVEVLP